LTEREKWERYTEEKQKLYAQNLTCAEYEKAVQEILDRLEL
jgi:hypothetical protein